ncbi:MAG: TRM11 family SAM-dependent methyltransferase, partial [Desulfurococcus sp.]
MKALVNYFLLRGDNEALGRGELKALLEAYECRDVAITCYTMLCIVRHRCRDIAERIVRRAGYIKEGGLLL